MRSPSILQSILLALVLALWPTVVAAQSAGAAEATPPTQFDSRPIKPSTQVNGGENAATTSLEWTRVVLALVIVIGLILALRVVYQKLSGTTPVKGQNGVRVVSRSVIAPRQHVILLQVGRRLLIVGDSGGTLSPLGEIADDDEVASLLGQLATRPSSPAVRSFGSLFGKVRDQYDDDPDSAPLEGNIDLPAGGADRAGVENPVARELQGELGSLMERVRLIGRGRQGNSQSLDA